MWALGCFAPVDAMSVWLVIVIRSKGAVACRVKIGLTSVRRILRERIGPKQKP
jgi:hypothetical protein